MAALDGQTFEQQPPEVQASFLQIWGSVAPQMWEMQHNAAIGQPAPMYYRPEVGPGTSGSVPYVNAANPGQVTTPPGAFPGFNLPAPPSPPSPFGTLAGIGMPNYTGPLTSLNAQSRGAGIAGAIPQGTGWIQQAGSPGRLVQFQPGYAGFLQNPQEAPGYIPGSGTYNQYDLSTPGLFDPQGHNLQFGSGGKGDPTTTGSNPLNAAQWFNAPRLFESTSGANLPGEYGTVVNNYLRGDTPSGIGGQQAPEWVRQQLLAAINQGVVRPTAAGWAYLQSQGVNPQAIGGAAPQLYAQTGGGEGYQVPVRGTGPGPGQVNNQAMFSLDTAGGGGSTTEDQYWQNLAATQAADQAARLTYQNWLMSTGNDRLAMEKAQQTWSQTFSERQQAFSEGTATAALTGQYQGNPTLAAQQQQFLQGVTAAGLTGQYNGAPTQEAQAQQAALSGQYNGQPTEAARQYNVGASGYMIDPTTGNVVPTLARESAQNQTATSLLGLASNLRGPSNYFSYLRTLGNTPGGLKDLVGGLLGQYQFAQSPGTPAGAPAAQRQSLASIYGDMLGTGGTSGTGGQGQAATDLSGIPLPSGDQWNARNTNLLLQNPTQSGLLQNLYEESGRNFGDELAKFKMSLPQYGGPRSATVGF